MRSHTAGITFFLAAAIGCQGGSESTPPPTVPIAESSPATVELDQGKAVADAEKKGDGFSGRHRSDDVKNWVPAEYKNGMARFKDPGVYADGVPVGILRFGELPVPLKPTWHEERAAVPFSPGQPGPRFKIVKQRRYRFADYFKAIGLDVSRIKEVHIYGGKKRAAAVVIKGAELRKLKDLTFRFGADTWGKPIPSCPAGIKDGKCPDNIGAVTVYLDKKPPTRRGGYFYLKSERVRDIPYFGEPLRGGVRVYLDGRLAATIKRRKLKGDELKVKKPDGKEHWGLFAFLQAEGVNTDQIIEGWIVQQDARTQRIERTALTTLSFAAASQRSGQVLLGDAEIPTNSIALHTRPVSPEDLPVILPHEREDT